MAENKIIEKVTASSTNGRLEIRSEEVQDILSYIPHWIIRWGVTIIFLAVLLILLASGIIKYPDIISTRITITTHNPPIKVIARSTGNLVEIFVKENDFVTTGTYLATIENPAKLQDIFELRKQLHIFESLIEQPEKMLELGVNKNASLGELQADYSNFLKNLDEYRVFKEDNYHTNKIKAISVQIAFYKDLNQRASEQKQVLAEDLELAKKKYDKDKLLFEKKLISENELDNSTAVYLQKKVVLRNAESTIINNNLQIAEYEKTIMDLKYEQSETNRTLLQSLQESFKRLQSQFANWEQRYILKAPVDGYLSFFRFWSHNQFVNAGDEVMTVVPDTKDIFGKIELPGAGAGKVKIGQTVRIKFDSYPFNEFGAVEGKVARISLIARDNVQLINVALANGLQTNFNKTLEFKQGMQGQADIVTEELRILERIFNQFRSVLSR
jgi:HlyD family secretion protein